MARISTSLAVLTLALTAGAGLAQAQTMTPSNALSPHAAPGVHAPMPATPSADAMERRMSESSTSSLGSTAPMPMTQPSAGYGMASSGYGTDPMLGGTSSTPRVPTPQHPFAGVMLPNQAGVGDGAYNGGGVVLEYLPDGTRRIVPR